MKEFKGDVIYQPKGKAREYAEFACNLFEGCPNQCTYCYAPGSLRLKRSEFKSAATPRRDIVERVYADAMKLAAWAGIGSPEVMFCFTCDPFPTAELIRSVTCPAIDALAGNGLSVATLTKRPMLALDNAEMFLEAARVNFGVTLTTTLTTAALKYEPHAELPRTRIAALSEAKRAMGLRTFVSLEPVMDEAQALHVIEAVVGLADEIRIGPINHDAAAFARVDWKQFYADAVALCARLGVKMVAKKALLKAAGVPC
jgi:DNA repair photolyase